MNLVVDTNIIFSAIISDKGKIGELLLNKPFDLNFFSPTFLLDELDNHSKRILSITKYSEEEYLQIKSFVTKNIEFIDPDNVSKNDWEKSYELTEDVDEDDASFVALSLQTNALLWTGDKKLIKGLKTKHFDNIITTDMLYTKYFGSR